MIMLPRKCFQSMQIVLLIVLLFKKNLLILIFFLSSPIVGGACPFWSIRIGYTGIKYLTFLFGSTVKNADYNFVTEFGNIKVEKEVLAQQLELSVKYRF